MMKKLLLLSLAAGSVLSASAQKNLKMLKFNQQTRTKSVIAEQGIAKKLNSGSFAKTTSTPFVTESFSGGTPTSLPNGWTSGNTLGAGIWRWANAASTYSFNIGALNSNTASDGWMLLDSDSIGSENPTLQAFSVYLQSPSFNCSGHNTVELSFQQYFRIFNDSCFVEVSNDGGNTFTTYAVETNNELGNTQFLPTNPTTTRIDITAVAGNQPDVIVRFLYEYNGPVAGGYNWLLDDVALSELDPLEFKIDGGAAVLFDGFGGFTSFGSVPISFILNPLAPVVSVSNAGADAPPFAEVSARIYKNGTLDYTSVDTLNDLAYGTQDSLLEFDGYIPNAIGSYVGAFSNDLVGDAISDNNTDTIGFQVSDSIYHRIGLGPLTTSYYIHRSPDATTNPPTVEGSFKIAGWFVIPNGVEDTLTGASVAFSSSTQPGANVNVVVTISQLDTTSGLFTEIARTQQKQLSAVDISGSNVVWSYFALDNGDPFTILGGTYAVSVVGNGIPQSSDVLVLAGPTSSGALNLIHGLASVSDNSGAALTADDTSTLSGFFSDAPLIRMHFGKFVAVSVKNVTSIGSLDAYPNPATNNVTVSFQLKNDAAANISVTNAVGQTVKTVNVGKVNANQQKDVAISTANLANGVYFYTIEANGEKLTKRIVISK